MFNLFKKPAPKAPAAPGLTLELLTERNAARATLRAIAAMETPSCAHIGKRMAAKAREGLAGVREGVS